MIRDITVRVVAGVLVVLILLLLSKVLGVALISGMAMKQLAKKGK